MSVALTIERRDCSAGKHLYQEVLRLCGEGGPESAASCWCSLSRRMTRPVLRPSPVQFRAPGCGKYGAAACRCVLQKSSMRLRSASAAGARVLQEQLEKNPDPDVLPFIMAHPDLPCEGTASCASIQLECCLCATAITTNSSSTALLHPRTSLNAAIFGFTPARPILRGKDGEVELAAKAYNVRFTSRKFTRKITLWFRRPLGRRDEASQRTSNGSSL